MTPLKQSIETSLEANCYKLHVLLLDELGLLKEKSKTLYNLSENINEKNLWQHAMTKVVPSAYLEQLCILHDYPQVENIINMQKAIKRYLIRINSTILEEFEKGKLINAIQYILKWPQYFKLNPKVMKDAKKDNITEEVIETVSNDSIVTKDGEHEYIPGHTVGKIPHWFLKANAGKIIKTEHGSYAINPAAPYDVYHFGQRGRPKVWVKDCK